MSLGHIVACLHQHADGGRRRVPDRDLVFLDYPVPRACGETALVDHGRDAVRARREHPVRRAGHPAGVGGAPVDVVRMHVQHELAGGVVAQHRLVDVDSAFRLARRARRVVHDRRVFGAGRHDLERLRRGGHQLVPR